MIVRKERPHPGAQLRITDADGHRVTAFATNTAPADRPQLADLELRHRRRARAEDRIRAAKDTGLTNLPLHDFDQNRIWCAIVALACELTAWTADCSPSPSTPPAGGNPNGCGCGCSPSPARLARTGRRTVLHLPAHAPWAELARSTALTDPARAAPPPADHATTRPDDPNRPGPWNRRPPERPRPNCHTHRAESPAQHRPPTGLDHHRTRDERSGLAPAESRSSSAGSLSWLSLLRCVERRRRSWVRLSRMRRTRMRGWPVGDRWVESVAGGLPEGRRDEARAAELGQTRFAADSVGVVVTHDEEQFGGGVVTDAKQAGPSRGSWVGKGGQDTVVQARFLSSR